MHVAKPAGATLGTLLFTFFHEEVEGAQRYSRVCGQSYLYAQLPFICTVYRRSDRFHSVVVAAIRRDVCFFSYNFSFFNPPADWQKKREKH